MTSEQVCAVIERETGQAVTEETPMDSLGVDSLEFIDLLLTLEDESGKNVPFEKAAELKTVGNLAREFA